MKRERGREGERKKRRVKQKDHVPSTRRTKKRGAGLSLIESAPIAASMNASAFAFHCPFLSVKSDFIIMLVDSERRKEKMGKGGRRKITLSLSSRGLSEESSTALSD